MTAAASAFFTLFDVSGAHVHALAELAKASVATAATVPAVKNRLTPGIAHSVG